MHPAGVAADVHDLVRAHEAVVDDVLDRVGMDDYEVVTIYLGEPAGEEDGTALAERISTRYPHLDSVEVARGGQPFYDFIISVE